VPKEALTAAPTETRVANPPVSVEENLDRISRLQAERALGSGEREYVLGAGDILTIRAFDFDDLNRRVRVEDDGFITLPLLERVQVAGRTTGAVQQDLTARLGEYMFDPHVDVFVEEYRSQHVSVIGSVRRPGLVALTNRDAKVLDAISAAGGMTDTAGGRIYLIPAEARASLEGALAHDIAAKPAEMPAEMPADAAAAMPQQPAATVAVASPAATDVNALAAVAPIMIDTNQMPQGVESLFFSLPVRAGDVIMVPTSGHFIVQGWVEKPGSYPLRAGVTLRGALAMSGGLSFPAKTDALRIHRLSPNGGTDTVEVDFSAIAGGKADDVFIHEGDVIEVGTSTAKMVPYSVYRVVTDVVRVGARLPLIP
jgi:polysaccharide export outer membrane protein